jgi:hypothetical protein
LYSLPNINIIKSSRTGWAGHVASTVEMRNTYKMLVGKPEEKRPLGRPWCGWRMILLAIRKIGWAVVDWIHVAQDRGRWRALVNTAINLWVL